MRVCNDFPVLAKSEPEITLVQHIEDCGLISEQLRQCVPNLPVADTRKFWRLLWFCIVAHDLGKAHPEFQRLLKKMKHSWCFQRHELLSLFFVEWLELPPEDKNRVRYAVAGHHKDLNDLSLHIANNYKTVRTNQLMKCLEMDEKPDFNDRCGEIDKEAIKNILLFFDLPFEERGEGMDIQMIARRLVAENPVSTTSGFQEYLLLAGALKQCDHLASAGVKCLQSLCPEDFRFLFCHSFYPHQQQILEIIGHVILSAPTGAGKTEAAWLWLKRQMEEGGQGRVFYVLPFTASINAMYERSNRDFGEKTQKVGMIHAKLAQYIEYKMAEDSSSIGDKERKQMIEDFKSLVTPVKIVTPFQLLKHLFGLKGFEKGMFEWAGCYLIFDEIHAYDSVVFGQIIVLLKFMIHKMGAKVLIMTATMPRFMRMELEKAVGSFVQVQASPELYEAFTRHRVVLKTGRLRDCITEIQERLERGRRVLVVCNTVGEAQYVYRNLNSDWKVLLHGSFNGEDRFQKERILKDDGVKLLVGTQAIEVSLDIDFDCIYTEPAPLDALIQRFGRVNRKRSKGVCDCFVFVGRNEGDKYIYQDEEVINRTLEVLGRMETENRGVIREVVLQEAIDFVYPGWSEKARHEYEQTLDYLEYSVLHELSPLKYNPKNEDDFYRRFNGVRVLPVSLTQRYEDFLRDKQWVKADSLLVNLNRNRFVRLSKQQVVNKERLVIDPLDTGKIYDEYVYKIHRRYDTELGLLIDEEERVGFEDIW